MVADIVEARADRVALIREIGRAYPDMNGSDDFPRASTSSSGSSTAPTSGGARVLAGDGAAPASESGKWW